MTTPYQESPDGAFTIGGGEWNYGQTLTDALAKAAFDFPMPTLENALDLLRMVLERLPLEALKPFQGFLGLADDLFSNVTDAVNAIIESIFEKPVWDALLASLQAIFQFVTSNALAQCIAGLAEDTGDFMQNFVRGFFGLFGNLWDLLLNNALVECIAGLVEDTGNLLENFIAGLLMLLGGLWEVLLNNPLAQCLVTWFTGLFGTTGQFLTDFAAAVAHLLSELAAFLTDNPLINAFKDLVEDSGLLLLNVANGAAEALQQLMNLIGLANPVEALEFLQRMVTDVWELLTGNVANATKTLQDIIEALTSFISRIPLIGPLVGYLTQGIEGIDFTPDFAGLSQWAERLLHTQSKIPAGNLFGTLPGTVLGTIPIGSVSNTTPNLLTQGGFLDASNISQATGWVWDSTKNRSGTGGSAQVNCATTSGTRQLYSNQNIPVAAGDRIGASAFVNTSGYNGSNISLQIGIVTFAKNVQKSTILLASRGGSNNVWGELTNSNSLWEVPKAANPADQITSVQVTIAVGNSATAGTANWDDVSLWKGGLMQQSLVEYLVSMTNGLLGGLSTLPNGVPVPFNVLDPWNYTLQAGAVARGTANTGVTNAAIADGKAVATNQAVFGVDVPSSTTTIQESRLPGSVGAVGSGIMLRRTTVGAYGNLGTGTGGPSPLSWYDAPGVSTDDITIVTSQGGITGVRLENSGWYVVEVSYGLNQSNTGNRVGNGAIYNYNWNFAPMVFYGVSSNLNAAASKYGADQMMICWNNGALNFGNVFGWSSRYAQSTFIIYLEAGQWVAPGYSFNGLAGENALYANGQGNDNYFSVSLLNRSLA